MDSVWKTFRAAKLGTSAAWALSVTAFATVLGHGTANAIVAVTCPTSPITTTGGPTPTSAAQINDVCGGTQITGTQSFPSYWEFTWNDASGTATIDAAITVSPSQTSVLGTLDLYDSTGTNVLASTEYIVGGSFSGDSVDPAISYAMTHGTEYVVGLTGPDPNYTVTYTDAPEPASLGIFGGALAALAAFRRRRKLSR